MTVNMHQYFYVEYFKHLAEGVFDVPRLEAEIELKKERLEVTTNKSEQAEIKQEKRQLENDLKNLKKKIDHKLKDNNHRLTSETFSTAFHHSPLKVWETFGADETVKTIYGHYQTFNATTIYPGLTIGLGIDHDLALPGVIKSGFSLDTITGLPYIPGSSLKGLFRSAFRFGQGQEDKKAYLLGLIQELKSDFREDDLSKLESSIFEHGDVFLGAFPKQPECENNQGALLGMDYITPHGDPADKKSIFKEPNPIPILKVKPDVTFTFAFLLKDGGGLSAEQKCRLFELLLCDLGIGAKTNVGFGQFKNS